MSWWLVPAWLDLELCRYLIACDAERTEEVNMADNRTQQERLHDKHGGLRGDNTKDAQKQGQAGQPKK